MPQLLVTLANCGVFFGGRPSRKLRGAEFISARGLIGPKSQQPEPKNLRAPHLCGRVALRSIDGVQQ